MTEHKAFVKIWRGVRFLQEALSEYYENKDYVPTSEEIPFFKEVKQPLIEVVKMYEELDKSGRFTKKDN